MRRLYTLLLYVALPAILFRLSWRSIKSPAYRRRWAERFGRFPVADVGRTLWIHAVSVGEVQAAAPLVSRLLEAYPQQKVVITTTTPTGSERVTKLFGASVAHVYFPLDLPFAVRGFLHRMRPHTLILIETEIWPNLLALCGEQGITTVLANARLSPSSAKRYARLGSFTQETFSRIGLVAAQSSEDGERFQALGVAPERLSVTGSIKFDIRLPASLYEQAEVLRRICGNRPMWVAASTHEGEEELVLEAHRGVLQHYPDALLVLVPRHPERFDRVASLCNKKDFQISRRSEGVFCAAESTVVVGDTMGELTLFIAAADVAFVGGSLVPVGGHNILEPAALGVPFMFGPEMFNFSGISRLMLEEEAAVQISGESGLESMLCRWLGDPIERARIGENGRRVVSENRGALDRLYSIIERCIQRNQAGASVRAE